MNSKIIRSIDWGELMNFVQKQSAETRFYLGSDSKRFSVKREGRTVWLADYAVILAVHIDGCHGCKLFGQIEREEVPEGNIARPAFRLMQEVYKIELLYRKLHALFPDRTFEIHLDLNPDVTQGSNCVMTQAKGFILGTTGQEPLVKPLAMAASFGADRIAAGR